MPRQARSFLVGGLLAAAPALIAAQAPLPSPLVDSRLVFLMGAGVERGWVDRAAEEIQKLDRFQLTASREEAALLFVLTTGQPGESVYLPLAGGGAVAGTYRSARLVVQDPSTGDLLWDDSRVIHWRWAGAIADLVKDLHKRIALDEVGSRSSAARREPAGEINAEDPLVPATPDAVALPLTLPIEYYHQSERGDAALTLWNGAVALDSAHRDVHDFIVLIDRVGSFRQFSRGQSGRAGRLHPSLFWFHAGSVSET